MNKQLTMLQKVLTQMDENVEMSKAFYENTIRKSKYDLIKDALHQIEHSVVEHGNCVEVNTNISKLLGTLNARYFNNQHKYCWPSHMCHFHMSLESWINCPFTCVTEINEFVGKLLKGD